MAIIVKYVVEHKGAEKLVTTDKKEADKYDKMLDVADNVAQYLGAKGVKLDDDIMEDLSILLSKNKEVFSRLFKGSSADDVLKEDAAEVVAMEPRQANG